MTFTAIKKSSHTWQKFSNDYDMIQLQNQQFTNNTLHERKCSTEFLVFSKGVLKTFANFNDKHPCRVKCEAKSLIYPCSLHLHYKKDCFSVSSAEFLRIHFLEHSWVSVSDFIFDIFNSSKYMKHESEFSINCFLQKK